MAGSLLLLALAASALLGAVLLGGKSSVELTRPRAQLTAAVLPAPE